MTAPASRHALTGAKLVMAVSGLAIVVGDQIGWITGIRDAPTGPSSGHFSSFYAMPKALWAALVVVPAVVLIVVPRHRLLLTISRYVAFLPALPLVGLFLEPLPHVFAGDLLARGRYAGVWVSAAGVVVGAAAAAVASAAADEVAKASTRPCPDCAEQILVAARVCKHCGTDLSDA